MLVSMMYMQCNRLWLHTFQIGVLASWLLNPPKCCRIRAMVTLVALFYLPCGMSTSSCLFPARVMLCLCTRRRLCVQASGFGQLKEGYVITSNTHYARRLLSRPPCPVLASLEKYLKQFEVAIGLNGRIWINSPSTARTVIACNAIQRAEFMSSAQTELLMSKLIDVAKS